MDKKFYTLLFMLPMAFTIGTLFFPQGEKQEKLNAINQNNRTATAIITNIEDTSRGRHASFLFTVEYELDGSRYTAQSNVSRELYNRSSVGESIEIRLHPTDRNVFDCNGCGVAIQGTEQLVYMGTVALAIVFVLFMWYKTRQKEARAK